MRATVRVSAWGLSASAGLALAGVALGQPAGRAGEPGIAELLGAVPPVVGRLDGRTLYLRAGAIDTRTRALPGVVGVGDGLRALKREQGSSGVVPVIQLDGPMTPERAAKLSAAGVRLGDYLPSHAWTADLRGADDRALASLGFVSWAGRFERDWKIDPAIGLSEPRSAERRALAAAMRAPVLVTFFRSADRDATLTALRAVAGVDVHYTEESGGNLTAGASVGLASLGAIAAIPGVMYVEELGEYTRRNTSTRWIVQTNVNGTTPLYYAGVRGEGQVIGILDGEIDLNHCSFSDSVNPVGPQHRKLVAYNAPVSADIHGTHVAGIAAGEAGSTGHTRGVAYMAKIAYNLEPSYTESGIINRLNLHASQGARVHTNSWGNDSTTAYDGLARGFDSFMHTNEDHLAIIAVTNNQLLRNPENAKNILAVGASQDSPNQNDHCSGGVGPTNDGRRKPEVYAPGCSSSSAAFGTTCSTTQLTGTSMAAPAVAGAAALTRQYFLEGFYPSGRRVLGDAFTPSGALLKAVLVNSSANMTAVSGYPSTLEGWGRVTLSDALYLENDPRRLVVRDVRNAQGLSTGQNAEVQVPVGPAGDVLRVTLAYTDPPASVGSTFARINDLNLEVVAPDGVTTYRGNVFDTATGLSIVGGSADDRNTVEQVHVAAPSAGVWTVRVVGAAVNQGTQGYALVVTGDVEPEPERARIDLADTLPPSHPAGVPLTLEFLVDAGADSLVAGSATLHYRLDGSGPFVEQAMTDLGGGLWRGVVPPAACADTLEFYASVEGAASGEVYTPSNAPASVLSLPMGAPVAVFSDSGESSTGWQVVNAGGLTGGAWARGVPAGDGTRGDPTSDSDGSGACWLTGNAAGDSDVDVGTTRLVSPTMNLAGQAEAVVQFDYWFTNNAGGVPGEDVFSVDITTNNGSSFVPAFTFPVNTTPGWKTVRLRLSDYVTPTATVRLRFNVSDLGSESVVEAGIDRLRVDTPVCTDPCPADANQDGSLDAFDFNAFVDLFNACSADPGCADSSGTPGAGFLYADQNADTSLDAFDFNAFVDNFNAGCP